MMTERLAATEERLASQHHDTLAAQLAAIKLTLAQSEYHVLQLQVRILQWESPWNAQCQDDKQKKSDYNIPHTETHYDTDIILNW